MPAPSAPTDANSVGPTTQSVQPFSRSNHSVGPTIEAAIGIAADTAPAIPVVAAAEGAEALAESQRAVLVVWTVPTRAAAARTERGLHLTLVVFAKVAVLNGSAVHRGGVTGIAVEVVVVVDVSAANLRAKFTRALVVAGTCGRHGIGVVLAWLPREGRVLHVTGLAGEGAVRTDRRTLALTGVLRDQSRRPDHAERGL